MKISTVIYSMTSDGPAGNTGPAFVLDEARGTSVSLGAALHLKNMSPTGFSWGYGGSGPAQLALAILHDAAGEELAMRFHQDFKWDVVAKQAGDWSIRQDYVHGWIVGRMRRGDLIRPGEAMSEQPDPAA